MQTSNTRQFAPKLYSELPETPVKELELDGTMVGPAHPAFKLALLTRMCNHHFGELRQFGGVWRLAYGRFNPPKWAKQLKREELIALETRTHPSDLRNWSFTPCLYTEEDGSRWKLACNQPQRRSVVDFGLPMMRSATGRGRPRLGPCLPCSTSMAMLGP